MSKREYQSWVDFIGRGNKEINVVAPGDEVDADLMVCRLAPSGANLLMPDNLLGHCRKCFRMIQFRPHAPKDIVRVCDECARREIAARPVGEEVKFTITENTARDLEEYKRRKKLS